MSSAADPLAGGTFLPIATARLTLRAFAAADVPAFVAYRNDPEVARFQGWDLPYPADRAQHALAASIGRTRPISGEWWQIAVDRDGTLAGDVAAHLDETGAVATIGYTFAPSHQRLGLATEAVAALVDRLFTRTAVHRIQASVDPANIASIRLLEGIGFVPEGFARRATEVGGEWLDEARFGLLREERAAWRALPREPPRDVRLVPITPANAREVRSLATFQWQQRLVGPNTASFADALVPDVIDGLAVVPWLRAIEADGVLVGFVMMAEPTTAHPHPSLWRLMIDRHHQRRGIGARVLPLLVQQAQAWQATELEVSWVPGTGSPARFYTERGFVATGEMDGDEVVARLTLVPTTPAPPAPRASR